MADISVIITAHDEGHLLAFSVKSAKVAIENVRNTLALGVELIISLDRPDSTTKTIAEKCFANEATLLYPDEGDLGSSRNFCAKQANGKYISFLDADDLWSYNWLTKAWLFAEQHSSTVCHPQVNAIFSSVNDHLYWHVDSDGGLFDPLYLRWGNYWSSLSFVKSEIFLKHPQKRREFSGFGYEDWSWNILTLNAGLTHKSVPETVHFIRRRNNSLLSRLSQVDAVVWPHPALSKEIERQ